jgi:glycosyltransferase involved in cell wall biosynthesis
MIHPDNRVEQVKVFGGYSRAKIVSAFRQADVFVCPSEKEVGPLVILEAMAAKTPWVSFPVGIVPSLKGGLVVETMADSIQTIRQNFAEKILSVLTDKSLSDRLSDEGYDYVRQHHDWDQIACLYDKLVRGVL